MSAGNDTMLLTTEALINAFVNDSERKNFAVMLVAALGKEWYVDFCEELFNEFDSLPQIEEMIDQMVHGISMHMGKRSDAVRRIRHALDKHYDEEGELS